VKIFRLIRKWLGSSDWFDREVCRLCDMSDKKCCKKDLSCAKRFDEDRFCERNVLNKSCCDPDWMSGSERSCRRSSKCCEKFAFNCKKDSGFGQNCGGNFCEFECRKNSGCCENFSKKLENDSCDSEQNCEKKYKKYGEKGHCGGDCGKNSSIKKRKIGKNDPDFV